MSNSKLNPYDKKYIQKLLSGKAIDPSLITPTVVTYGNPRKFWGFLGKPPSESRKATRISVMFENGIIHFLGEEIKISGVKELKLCNVLMSKSKLDSKLWELGDIIEAFGERPWDLSSKQKKELSGQIYRATLRVNAKVAQQTSFQNFILNRPMGTAQLNPEIFT